MAIRFKTLQYNYWEMKNTALIVIKRKIRPVLNLPTDNIGSKEVKIKRGDIFHFIEVIKW